MSAPLRVGIVNDSPTAAEALRRVITAAPGYQVAWIASDGQQAVDRTVADRPDLLLMDLLMPHVDGVVATRDIMSRAPCAIVVVTATVTGHVHQVFAALAHGALDAVDTPVLGPGGDVRGGDALIARLEAVTRIMRSPERPRMITSTSANETPSVLVAIGASTGGPQAIAEVLRGLGPRFDGAILLVQHIDADFAPGMVSWLTEVTGVTVSLAADRDVPTSHRALFSSSSSGAVLTADGRLTLEPANRSLRTIDRLFQSIAQHWHSHAVGVLLTGMGRDGAEGLLEMRRTGFATIAQDEATSVVYGMPRAAAELRAAGRVVPLREVARAILDETASQTRLNR